MASSGIQLIGFLLALVGLATTTAATWMVQWKKQSHGKSFRSYEGLWMSCSGNERVTCDFHDSVLKLSPEVQATRAVLILSIFLSAVAVIVSTVGMKCTHFMDDKARTKAMIALIGGILFLVSGLLTIIITSWYVKMILQTVKYIHATQSIEFGKAVFVAWAGGLLTVAGGTFLSCRRCSRSEPSQSRPGNPLISTTNSKSNYV
ncbi:claudin-1 [Anabas testudineus]|uniref:Claudin n=1 Tax=Anabas testudineus TaxID=64144 RepID=A0A3Q1I0K3_ANATE|nr:claudin-1 [Anabas testudineus]